MTGADSANRPGRRIGRKALVNLPKPGSVSHQYNVGIASVRGAVSGGVNGACGGVLCETGVGFVRNGFLGGRRVVRMNAHPTGEREGQSLWVGEQASRKRSGGAFRLRTGRAQDRRSRGGAISPIQRLRRLSRYTSTQFVNIRFQNEMVSHQCLQNFFHCR